MAATLRASKEGLAIIDRERKKKGWKATAVSWYQAANTSEATLKRFRRGLPIQQNIFVDICKAVGIEKWEEIVDNTLIESTSVTNSPQKLEKAEIGGVTLDISEALKIPQVQRFAGVSADIVLEPPILEHWQGRDVEIQQLTTWLADSQVKLIGIRGFSGVGKSWLASYIYENFPQSLPAEARTEKQSSESAGETEITGLTKPIQQVYQKFWADVRQRPDFIAFAQKALMELAGKSPDDLQSMGEPEQLIYALVKFLKQQPCLLIIDNLETLFEDREWYSLAAYCNFFTRWLDSGTTSTLLVTTQIQPEVMERRGEWLNLQGLSAQVGAQLLRDLGIAGTDAKLQEFAVFINGHPKTLQLVAGYLKEERTPNILAAEELGFRELHQLLNNLDMPYRDNERVTFFWILEKHFQALTPDLQRFLGNLSIYHRRPFNSKAAAVVLSEDITPAKGLQAKKALDKLIKRSLLDEVEVRGERGFQFHPFVWQYAKQKAGEQSEQMREKVITYYQNMTTDKTTWKTLEDVAPYLEIFYHRCEQQQYVEAFDAISICDEFLDSQDYNNVRIEIYQQLVQAGERNDLEKEKFAESLHRLFYAYYHIGDYRKSIEYCQQAFKIAQEVKQQQIEATALSCMGSAYSFLGQLERAIEIGHQALAMARAISYSHCETACLINLGNAYYRLSKYEEARGYFQQAVELAQKNRYCRLEGNAINGLGAVCSDLSQYPQAIEYFQQAIQIQQQVGGRRHEEANSLTWLAGIYSDLKEYGLAAKHLHQALEIIYKLGYRPREAWIMSSIGCDYYALERYQESIDCFQRSLEIAREIGNQQSEANALYYIGRNYDSLEQYQQAIEFFQQWLKVEQERGDKQAQANAFNWIAHAYRALAQYQESIDYFQQELKIERELGNQEREANALHNIGRNYNSLEQYQQAIEFFQQWLKVEQERGDRQEQANAFNWIAYAYRALAQYQESIDYFQQRLEIERELGNKENEANALYNIGCNYNSLEQYQQAIDCYQMALEIQQERGDKKAQAKILDDLWIAYLITVQNELSDKCLQQIEEIRQEIGDLW
jgi:tetratricopeptide (TPR) repeat protein